MREHKYLHTIEMVPMTRRGLYFLSVCVYVCVRASVYMCKCVYVYVCAFWHWSTLTLTALPANESIDYTFKGWSPAFWMHGNMIW